MIPELGQLCTTIALCLAVVQTFFPLVGAQLDKPAWMAVARPAAVGQFVFLALGFGFLEASFISNDFSVLVVAATSNSHLPIIYRVAALWGGHEGSLMLWVLLLAIWTIAVTVSSRRLPEALAARIIGVMGFISAGLLLYIISVSNPFLRLSPVPMDGNDLNPLLQDPAMALHPPILYTGYVGFSVAFAYAIAAMLAGRVDRQWARWARPWTTAAWMFLTIGIALGSWWAYYELGWGGWWFWDPVENASFMPWLLGTALIHSLAVTEKRDLFKGSTLLLAIGAFSLSLLGTFLVRSGVLVSVHAFASDPARGVFILCLLTIIIGGALAIYAWRAPELDRNAGFKLVSRETFILVNNILLSVAAGLILLGTLYPLVLDALHMGKISVGKPYFDTVFIIPALPLVIAAGFGMHAAWKSTDSAQLLRKLRWPAVISVICGIAITALAWGTGPVLTYVGVAAGIWLLLASLRVPVMRLLGKAPRMTASMLGMQLAHAGIGLFVIGVTVASTYSIETDQSVRLGETVQVADYAFTFNDLQQRQGPNYTALRADIDVTRDGRKIAHLNPEKRIYRVQTMPMTEAGIDAGLGRDLFVALGDDLGDNAWSLRIQYKPMLRFIWIGCLAMALARLIAIGDRRYRAAVQTETPAVNSDTATRPA